VPFDAIEDARNSEPIIRIREPRFHVESPHARVYGFDPEALEAIQNIDFSADVWGMSHFQAPPQPYRLVFFGEKTSLDPVLGPLAERYDTDLYLPSGEISDTLLHLMAKTGAEDGREMVVFIFSDCDPAGYQMAVSIGHKLRAFSDSLFPDLRFRVVPACLSVEQVKELGLPSTPLKETEKRKWREKHGVDQTEIDALATLQPDVFRQIVHDAVAPYYDATLAKRVQGAQTDWWIAADRTLRKTLAGSGFDEARAEAEEEIGELVTELTDEIEER
jgi:hypothetical protein